MTRQSSTARQAQANGRPTNRKSQCGDAAGLVERKKTGWTHVTTKKIGTPHAAASAGQSVLTIRERDAGMVDWVAGGL